MASGEREASLQEVFVTHVKISRELGQVNFWAQLDANGAEKLEELDLIIQEKANADPNPPEPKSLLVGEPCLANFIEDSRWYRARVEQCTENDVIAYFMDYGNTEIIPFNLIRRADSAVFSTLRAQATECVLEGVKMADKSGVLSYVKQLMSDQSFSGKPAGFIAGRVHMALYLESESQEAVADKIIREGFGAPMKTRMPSGSGANHSGGGGDRRLQFKNMGLDAGSREKLYISHVESPSSFWIQQACISLDLDNLMNDLMQFYCEGTSGEVVRRAEEGMACVALFSEDESFYRATVDKMLANNQCRVFFVDYGNSEVTKTSNLRLITGEFLKLPTIAIRCCLSGIEEASCNSPEASAKFEELTGEKELCGKVVGFKSDKCAILLVDPNGKENADIAGVLVKEGLAKRDQEQFPMKGSRRTERTGRASPVSSTSSAGSLPAQQQHRGGRLRSDEVQNVQYREPQGPTSFTVPNLKPYSKHQVQVTSVESLTNISCQMLADSEAFDVMMTNLQDEYASQTPDTKLGPPHVNQVCCGQFTEDDSWYRAQITAVKGSNIDVKYVDYGNSETISVTRLRAVKSQFFELPLQCISCSVGGLSPEDQSSPEVRDHFEEITSEKTLIANIINNKHEASGDVYDVILTEEGTGVNINREMQEYVIHSRVTPPRNQVQSSQPARTSQRDQQPQQGHGQRTPPRDQRPPPRDQLQKSVKSPSREEFGSQSTQAPSPSRPTAPAEPTSFTEVQLPSGGTDVYLAHGNGPLEFWCQPVKSGGELDELMGKIESKYAGAGGKSLPGLKNPAVGTPCVAQFTDDEGWYRAVVVNKHVGELEVLFVDYGNSERVKMAKVKQISADLMKMPAAAVKCALKGWDLGKAEDKTMNRMRDLANSVEHFKCESQGNSGGVYEVELSWKGNNRMGQELRKIQMQALQEKKQKESAAKAAAQAAAQAAKAAAIAAQAPKPAPPSPVKPTTQMISSAVDNIKHNAHEDFIVSHVDDPTRFWCQLAKDCGTLDEMMIKINDHYNTSRSDTLESVLVGGFCVAKYTADDGWYRAQILKTISTSQVEVHFIDYGNTDKIDVSELRKVRPEFSKLKSQAVQCALHDVTGDNYEQELITQFEELVMDKQLVGDVKAKRAGMIALDLFDTSGDHDVNINQEVQGLIDGGSQGEVVGYPPLTEFPKECEAYATHIEGVHQFFVQMSSETEAIETMSSKLQDAYSTVGPSDIKLRQISIGQSCCAKFSEDEQWYRAIITDKPTPTTAKLCFVDFGNSEEQDISKLKVLKPEFLQQAPLAIECRLGKCRKNMPEAVEKFEEMILDKPLMCYFHGNSIAPFGVTLMDGECKVNEEMSAVVGTGAIKMASDDDGDGPFSWPPVGNKCVEVNLTHVTNPSEFWCQLSGDSLQTLSRDLQEVYSAKEEKTETEENTESKEITESEENTESKENAESEPNTESEENAESDPNTELEPNAESEPKAESEENAESELNAESEEKAESEPITELEPNAETESTTWLPGMACVSRSESGTWQRAEVLSAPVGDSAEVLFVDTGITETVPKTKLWEIDEKFMSLPRQAIRCKLAAVKPCSAGWEESAIGAFRRLTSAGELIAEVMGIDRGRGLQGGQYYQVLLRSRLGHLISNQLTERGHAQAVELDSPREIIPKPSSWQGKTYPREVLTTSKQDVSVVRAENPNRFFAQPLHFLAMREDLVMEIEAFTEGILGNLVLPDWLPTAEIGMPCLAMNKYKKQWCRAEVNNLLPKGQILVLFVDDGMNQIVFTSDLRPINAKLVDMPAMAIECTLKSLVPADGSSIWPDSTCEAFEEMMLDQKFGITVDDEGAEMFNEEEKSIHEILKEMGLALSPEEAAQAKLEREAAEKQAKLEREAAEKDAQIAAEKAELIATQPKQIVYFLSAIDPAQIVCQPASSADSLAELMDNIAAFYGSNQSDITPEVGEKCIAQFTEDDGWYRANIEAIDESNITVRYIDYGNSEVVMSDRLRSMQPQFAVLPAQAVTYTVTPPLMEEDEWKDNMKALLENSCVEREMKVTLLDSTPVGFSIKLSEEDLTFMTTSLTETPPVATVTPTGEGGKVSLIFLSADGPSTFICQPVSTADALAILMDNIAAHYEDEANQAAHTPEVGQQCIAKFTEDDGWYRAVVEAIDGDSVTVRYIDYGNSEVLTGDRLRAIQSQFTELPAQAITYQLSSPLMLQDQWNEVIKAGVDENCVERELSVDLDESNEIPTVTLSSVDTGFIASVLMDSLTADRAVGDAETLKLGEAVSLIFLSAEGPSSFSCQPLSSADELATLMDNIAAFYEDEANQIEYMPDNGQQIIAKFTEDDGWYRAQVEAVSEDGISVKYIDYGNSETVTKDRVCEIQPQFQELSAQAVVCRIKPDLMHPSQWNDDVKAMLDEGCAEKELNAHYVKTLDGSLTVQLSKDDVEFIKSSVASILPPADLQASKPAVEAETLELGEAVSLIFLSATGPSSFSCQPLSSANDLAILMDNIAAFYEDEVNQVEYMPEVGQQCIAKFTEDDGWYRAQVEAVSEDGISVKYIDYGNSEMVTKDRVCEIQPQFQELSAQAVVYQIKPDLMHPSQWNDDVKATLDESCAERELNAHFVKTSDSTLVVKLSQDDVDFIMSSVESILPPAVIPASEPKDEVDEIAETLVNTAITEAIEEMTVPANITAAAGVNVMSLFNKVAECLLIDELKKDGPHEGEDEMKGVKKLVEDIVSRAVAVVSGESEGQTEEEAVSHQILDELIDSVATGLHITSATDVLDGESDADKELEGGEHPSPQRKRHKSGEGLPGMENYAKVEDIVDSDDDLAEVSEEMEGSDCPEPKKRQKLKEGESTDGDEEEEEDEDFEDAEDNVESKDENKEATQDEVTTSDKDQGDDADTETEGTGGEDADKETEETGTGDVKEDEGPGDDNATADSEAQPDQIADENKADDQSANPEEESNEDNEEMDQEESFESAPSTPERDSEAVTGTAPTEEGSNVVNGENGDVENDNTEDTNVNEEASETVNNKVVSDKTNDISDEQVVSKASEVADDVAETEETVEA